METSPFAGKVLDPSRLINVPRLITAYYSERPDVSIASQKVAFGTSGHRGSALDLAFNEAHILAITQAICVHRRRSGISGPLFLGMDTHALSEPAFASALEVLSANNVETIIDDRRLYTPTPVISHAILTYNRKRTDALADGIVITPSHNPPRDGGFKYNPPTGGPASAAVTKSIETMANQLIADELRAVRRISFARALKSARRHDYVSAYVNDLENVIDMEAIRNSGRKLGVDPLGGASVHYWSAIAQRYKIALDVVNDRVDPAFAFMPADWDGKIRMDCSSPFAMARLLQIQDHFDIAFGNDTDADRHGIVTRRHGLLNPNHYLAVAIEFLFRNRPGWRPDAAVGKTIVSSSIIDRVTARAGRRVVEVPVGFKWFVDGLMDGSFGFCGEESAGASLLRRDGAVWTTDKDGIVMNLLACEILARSGRDPGEIYDKIAADCGATVYERIDAPASPEEKKILQSISADEIAIRDLGGEKVDAVVTVAPGNHEPIGGVKVTAPGGWFAARPSGTEDVYKIYAESFVDELHLRRIQEEAQTAIAQVFRERSERGR